jgi:hypothetical protein
MMLIMQEIYYLIITILANIYMVSTAAMSPLFNPFFCHLIGKLIASHTCPYLKGIRKTTLQIIMAYRQLFQIYFCTQPFDTEKDCISE